MATDTVHLSVFRSDDNNAKTSSTARILQSEQGANGTGNAVKLEQRPGWDNKAQFLLAAIGFAVGLGNVWRFPWLCQKNGGGAFLIPYVVMLIFEGIPIFYLELSLGQRMRQGSISVWSTVSPYLGGVGIASTVICILVGSYYNVVISWVLFYFFNSFKSPLPWADCPTVIEHDRYLNTTRTLIPDECAKSSPTTYFFHRDALQHANRIDTPSEINWRLALCLFAGWLLAYLCIIRGIKSSGKVVYFTATLPYVVLFAFFIRGLFLKGYEAGVIHLFTPKWQKLLDPLVWLDAATQIFFSLGVAFGTIVAYASYNPIHENTLRDAVGISVTNCLTSLFAAVVVFSILGFRATYMMEDCEAEKAKVLANLSALVNATLEKSDLNGLSQEQIQGLTKNISANITSGLPECNMETFLTEAASGPGLCFIAFTDAINQMPGSTFWSLLFFLMLLALGLDSLFGALESVTTALQDVRGFKRLRKEVLSALLCLLGFLIGLVMVTDAGEYVLQLFDSFCANLPLLLIALCECVGVCYFYGIRRFSDDIEFMTGSRPGYFWVTCWMFVTPVAMLTILIANIVLMSKGDAVYYAWSEEMVTYEEVPYPPWAISVAVLLILASVVFIPGIAIARYFNFVEHKRTEPIPFPVLEQYVRETDQKCDV